MHNLQLDAEGWLADTDNISIRPSPNHDLRPDNIDPTLVVIHNISLPPNVFTGTAVIDFFLNQLDFDSHPWFENIRGVRVSAHFLIRRDGSIIQFVPTTKRAWHAGVSQFNGRERCNDFSIGIELEGTDEIEYTESQYTALQQLIDCICARHPIRDLQGHCDIAPGRKTDPGPAFNWQRVRISR